MKVLYTGPADQMSLITSRLNGYEIIYATNSDEIRAFLPDCHIIIDASIKFKYTRDELATAKCLELFVAVSTGIAHIDSEYLVERGIPLFSLLGRQEIRNITGTAELAWALLLSLSRKVPQALAHVASGQWDRNSFPGSLLINKTLGVIGCGRLGCWVSRYGRAFGMKSYGYDPYYDMHKNEFDGELVDLKQLLTESDFISLHVSLTPTSKNILSHAEFDIMKKGVVIINTSQSQAIDESALLDAIITGRVAGAGLDVLRDEPNINNSELYKYSLYHDNLVITPHIGGYCPESLVAVLNLSCDRILEFKGDR